MCVCVYVFHTPHSSPPLSQRLNAYVTTLITYVCVCVYCCVCVCARTSVCENNLFLRISVPLNSLPRHSSRPLFHKPVCVLRRGGRRMTPPHLSVHLLPFLPFIQLFCSGIPRYYRRSASEALVRSAA